MIHPTQLRIGNLISSGAEADTVNAKVVTAIQKDIVSYSSGDTAEDSLPYDKLTGIYLTGQILENSGFEKDLTNDDYYYFTIQDFRIACSSIETWIEKGEGDFVEEIGVEHCKYVHDLQNLIYALTGKELTIKL